MARPSLLVGTAALALSLVGCVGHTSRSGTIGNAEATGTASMQGRRLVLSGTARSSTSHEDPVYLALTGDESRRWGATLNRFAGREERASVALEKTS
jgi:hypothetical protein